MTPVRGNHHLTFAVGPVQEDYDFHTGLLGLRNIKRTVLYDGTTPIYHLYYGNARGDAGTILTSFPFRQAGVRGRRGSNQIKILTLSVPAEALGFWADRFAAAGVACEETEAFGTQRLRFSHPCGIEYALVADGDGDPADSWEGNGVSAEHAILGTHGITISVAHAEEMHEFLVAGVGAKHVASEGPRERYELGTTGRGKAIELLHEPGLAPGTWRFGEGTVHHAAYDAVDASGQKELKDRLEGLGYTDCSDVKDRGYFFSVYVRTPSGALFEFAWSKPELWAFDEDADRIGEQFVIPPQFEERREEIMAQLEPLKTERAAR